MNTNMVIRLSLTAAAAFLVGAGAAFAQQEAPAKGEQPKHAEKPGAGKKASERVGDPYPLDTCPISGKKLGAMGDPVIKLYDGREVRYCCDGCPDKFEKDKAASLAKVDEKIIKDQALLYPLKTSVVTGKDLPEKPFEFVYANRLVRLGAESEKADFLKDAKNHLGTLDKAVVEKQSKDYPLTTCPVSKEELGSEGKGMGKPVNMVVASRLIRLCCKDCKDDVDANPAKIIATIDAARKDKK